MFRSCLKLKHQEAFLTLLPLHRYVPIFALTTSTTAQILTTIHRIGLNLRQAAYAVKSTSLVEG